MKKLCLILALTAFVQSSPIVQTNDEYRLPEDIYDPINYDLKLKLNDDVFETNIFTGSLNLKLKILKTNIKQIKIHANEKITISLLNLLKNDNVVELDNAKGELNPTTEILTINAKAALEQNVEYILHIEYTAELRTDDMYGFYKSSYKNSEGEVKFLATTQFQPTHARRAFPCFDEPSFKSTFNIQIDHPSNYKAFGNTIGISTTTSGGTTLTTFKETPKMSTYLVAFIVSDFTCDEGMTVNGALPYRVCSREEAKSTRTYAYEIGPKLLSAMEDFTNIKYEESGIGKMDQVAIPDFAAGAMENWGLVTYRETALLWSEEDSSNRYKQRVATVIAHEFSHMWFGDWLTTHWWSDTFLNEGWATYFEFFITAQVENSWELEKQFVLEEVHGALKADAESTSKALSSQASTPTEVSSRFGTISYSKGGSVYRMVEHIMTSEEFKKGIRKYLLDNKFGVATPEKLWTAFGGFVSQAKLPTGKSLADVMKNWVEKPGYPLLQVTTSGDNVLVSQKRFLTSDDGTDQTKWYVPISYTKSNDGQKFKDTTVKNWLLDSQNLTITNALKDADWIILNNQQTGYYRVNYDDTLWVKISEALNQPGFSGIDELNKAQIVDDLFSLAKIGIQTYAHALDWTSFLKNEVSYYPWYAAFNAYSDMFERTESTDIRTKLSEHILTLMANLYNSVPFNNIEEYNQIYTHKQVLTLTWACKLGFSDCVDNAKSSFKIYKNSATKTKPNKNLRSVVYCTALRNSADTEINENWNFLWNEFSATKLSSEQVTILTALGCTTKTELLNGYLDKSINGTSGIRPQDALSVFSSVYNGNPEGVDVALNFLIANYKKISSTYGSLNSLSSLINGLANKLTTQEQFDKLKTFISTTTDLPDSIKTSAQTALAKVEINLNWISTFETELSEYFGLTTSSTNSITFGPIVIISAILVSILQIISM